MSDRRGTLQELINTASEAGIRSIYTSIPCKVVKRSGLRVDVQILIKDVTQDEAEERVVESWPVVCGVPIEFPGANEFRMTVPVTDGSNGTEETIGRLEFSHLSLDKWLTGKGEEVDPEFDHDHALADAVFVPGLRPFGNPYQSMPTDAMTIGSDADGKGRIHFKRAEVQLGDGATKGVIREGDRSGKGYLAVIMGVGPLAASVASVVYTDPDGAVNTLTTGNLGPVEVVLEAKAGSGAIKAVD